MDNCIQLSLQPTLILPYPSTTVNQLASINPAKMCYLYPRTRYACGHEGQGTQQCHLWPNCPTRVVLAPDPVQHAPGLCFSCSNGPNHQPANNMMNDERYIPQYQEAFGGNGAAYGNIAQNGHVAQNGNVAQNGHAARNGHQAGIVAAPQGPQAPRAPIPNNPNPHLAAIHMHRDRLTEIENGFQIFLVGIQNPNHNNVQSGQGNQIDNLADLIANLHIVVADLNRQYLRQVNEMIEILESIRDQPDLEPEPQANFDLDVGAVPDLEDDEEDDGLGLLNGHRNGNAYRLPNGGIQPLDRPQNPQMNGHHGPMIRIPLLNLQPSERQCTICMQEIGSHEAEDEHPVRLPCGHVFGNLCIRRWLVAHGTCPVCRRDYSDEL